MKAAVIFAEDVHQICLQPENKGEEAILQLIAPDRDIQVAVKRGSLYDRGVASAFGAIVARCHGEYYRVYESPYAVMLVLTPKPEPEPKEQSATTTE